MKEIYFLRHGEADWPDWKKSDDERPLTKRGRAEMERVARFLESIRARPKRIVTSPLPRAAETAKIAADRLKAELVVDELVRPGFDLDDLERLSRKFDVDSIMVVGHEPDFSSVIRAITGGKVKMSKAGVALVRVNGSVKRGVLRWLFPPGFSKRLPSS